MRRPDHPKGDRAERSGPLGGSADLRAERVRAKRARLRPLRPASTRAPGHPVPSRAAPS